MTQDQKDMIQFIRGVLGMEQTASVRLTPVVKGGSDRAFYRVTCDAGLFICMRYDPARIENNYYADIARFLHEIGLHVPNLIGYDPERYFILMEDLGEKDLWSFRDDPWPRRKVLYEAALAEILNLHSFNIDLFREKKITLMPGFDRALYAWEHDYFLDEFVWKTCGTELKPDEAGTLARELDALSAELAQAEPCLVHRDFQSQNIMICDGKPGIIDFQGMRSGTALYDLGSLLYDPYVQLNENERMELLRFYYDRAGSALPIVRFESLFRKAASQRLMQALGAFGYLGLGKGMKAFLDHIPQGVLNLIDASRRAQCLPVLNSLAIRCREAMAWRK